MSLLWSTAFSVGVPTLDADHEELMQLINAVEQALLAGRRPSAEISAFSNEMVRHAERELDVLRRYNYDKHTEMFKAHEDLSEIFSSFRNAVDHGASIDNLLNLWLDYQNKWIGVLVTHSMDYKQFFEENGIAPHVENRERLRDRQQAAAAHARATGEPCGWDEETASHDQLAEVLFCAASFGCPACVSCSEKALTRLIEAVRAER